LQDFFFGLYLGASRIQLGLQLISDQDEMVLLVVSPLALTLDDLLCFIYQSLLCFFQAERDGV